MLIPRLSSSDWTTGTRELRNEASVLHSCYATSFVTRHYQVLCVTSNNTKATVLAVSYPMSGNHLNLAQHSASIRTPADLGSGTASAAGHTVEAFHLGSWGDCGLAQRSVLPYCMDDA